MQAAFRNQSNSLIQAISEYGNPILDDHSELLVLHSHECADESVVKTVQIIEVLSSIYKFRREVFIDKSKSIHAPIKKNSLPLFKTLMKAKGNPKTKDRCSLE